MGRRSNLNFIVYFFALVIFFSSTFSDAGSIGVDYDRVANDLPQPASIVQLLKNNGLNSMKIYPNQQKVYPISLGGGGGQGQSWCVANENADPKNLQDALDFACGQGGADCSPIQPGATCYDPNTLEAHASYAFNSYYQKQNRAAGSCDFSGTAHVVTQAPKFGDCVYPTGPGIMIEEGIEERLEEEIVDFLMQI